MSSVQATIEVPISLLPSGASSLIAADAVQLHLLLVAMHSPSGSHKLPLSTNCWVLIREAATRCIVHLRYRFLRVFNQCTVFLLRSLQLG